MNIELANDKIDLPDGSYAGLWSAYRIRILRSVRNDERTLETMDGCRSLDGMPVTVVVVGGRATAEEG